MIPDKAFEAAEQAYWEAFHDGEPKLRGQLLRAALEAAVPYLTADATPDDEAALTKDERSEIAFAVQEGDASGLFVYIESILAGRVSGRADAAAQALEDAAACIYNGAPDPCQAFYNYGLHPWLMERAAQYREKGKAQ